MGKKLSKRNLKKSTQPRLFCGVCGSRNIYSLKDKTRVCRKCGCRWEG